jgi:hypothetical protein
MIVLRAQPRSILIEADSEFIFSGDPVCSCTKMVCVLLHKKAPSEEGARVVRNGSPQKGELKMCEEVLMELVELVASLLVRT